jgi:hypothetical protein
MNPIRCSRLQVLVCMVAFPLALAHSQGLPQPKGPVLLTVGGHISVRNAGELAVFDAAMLNALQVHEITTKSPWKKTVMRFTGPSIRTLLKAVGAQGTSLKLSALDKYEATMPMDDVTKFDPVLALRVDGVALTVRTQGPVLVMYPFDNVPAINTDLFAGRAVWQLQRIVVE